jgi:hypothetical protein
VCSLLQTRRVLWTPTHSTDPDAKVPGELTVRFSDFAVAKLIFDKVISRSLSHNAQDEEIKTGEMVKRISDQNGYKSVEASDLLGEPGVTSMDKAYRLLKRAVDAGTIHPWEGPTRNNEKFYLPMPNQGFLGSPGQVYKHLKADKRSTFVHPFTGVSVTYVPQK